MAGDKKAKRKNKLLGPKEESLRISLKYLLVGLLWIILSDKALQLFIKDFEMYSRVQLYKGWFYVIVTTILVYLLVYRRAKIIKSAFADLGRAAYVDSLTELPNKTAFILLMDQYINEKKPFHFAYIDLDNFRFINDILGHKAGDEYLVFISKGLSEGKKLGIIPARLGGDEFGIILPGDLNKKEFEYKLKELIKSFGKFWKINNHQFYVSFSTGVVKYPGDGSNSSELYKNANIAMNKCKKSGKNSVVFYEEVHLKDVTESVRMANELQEAIEKDELMLHYQPVFNLENLEKVGIEALIRWQNKKRGYISPADFIPLAEETGQILTIDRWVVKKVLQMKQTLEEKGKNWTVAINLSSRTLMGEVNFSHFIEIFKGFNIDFSGVTIEITETAIINDVDLAIERINQLRDIGLKIALDDFGTGYSSLNHLKNLPIDIVKLDRSFIRSISGDNRESIIIRAIITLSMELGFDIIAEGIETEEQLDYLRKNKCPLGQGFYLQSPDVIEKIL